MRTAWAMTFLFVVSVGARLWGQETPGPSAAQPEHEWLTQFVGEWDSVSEGTSGPDQPPVKSTGTVRSRMLGKIWMVSESTAEVMGSTIHAVQTIGYDPQTKRFVGTWVDSMFNHMWQYDGSLDDARRVLTLEAEGPDFSKPGRVAKYRDAYEFKSKDHIVATSSMMTPDGKWVTFMTGHLTRKK